MSHQQLIWLVGIVASLIALPFSLNLLQRFLRALNSKNWAYTFGVIEEAKVESTIHDGRVRYYPRVTYSYTPDSEESPRTSDTLHFGIGTSFFKENDAENSLNYWEGRRVKVYYDPKNPKYAVLEPGMSTNAYISLFLSIACASFPLIFVWAMTTYPPN